MSTTTQRTGKATTLVLTLLFGVLLACVPALAAATVDQEQTGTASGVGLDARYPAAQQFTAGRSGSLERVSLNVSLFGSRNVGDLHLAVQSVDVEGRPTGTVLGTASLPVEEFTPGAQPTWRDLSLAQPVAVAQGTRYALVVSGQNRPQDGAGYNWRASFGDPYPGGDAMWIHPSTGLWEVRTDLGVPIDFAFRTFVSDVDPPTVVSTTPEAKATGVSRGGSIAVTFSEAMDPATFTKRAIVLREVASGRRVPAVVSCDADPCTGVTLDPYGDDAGRLKADARYRVTISTLATDVAGNRLDTNPRRAGEQGKAWTFTTGRR